MSNGFFNEELAMSNEECVPSALYRYSISIYLVILLHIFVMLAHNGRGESLFTPQRISHTIDTQAPPYLYPSIRRIFPTLSGFGIIVISFSLCDSTLITSNSSNNLKILRKVSLLPIFLIVLCLLE